jgi:transcriptional regulator with XRE-family HTH domain
VDNAETGRRIKERRSRLGMTVKDLAERAGVDRGRLAKLEEGDESVRQTTIGAVEAALDRIGTQTEMRDASVNGQPIQQLEFVVEDGSGVKVTVKGPITDRAALESSVANIIRSIREA